jgi:hypothetical protein
MLLANLCALKEVKFAPITTLLLSQTRTHKSARSQIQNGPHQSRIRRQGRSCYDVDDGVGTLPETPLGAKLEGVPAGGGHLLRIGHLHRRHAIERARRLSSGRRRRAPLSCALPGMSLLDMARFCDERAETEVFFASSQQNGAKSQAQEYLSEKQRGGGLDLGPRG